MVNRVVSKKRVLAGVIGWAILMGIVFIGLASLQALAIGLALTLIHLISIPVTNPSVNPARSTGVALFVGDWAIDQLWLFWVAPIVGALLGAAIYHFVASEEAEHVQPSVARAALGTAAILK